jgi:hypothetical protein
MALDWSGSQLASLLCAVVLEAKPTWTRVKAKITGNVKME